PASEAMGLRRLALAVPSFQEDAAALSPPLFAPPSTAWIVARAAEGVTPLPGEGDGGLPAARPVLVPGAEATFRALARRLAPEARLTAQVRGRAAPGPLAELPVRLAGRSAAGAPDLEVLTAAVALGPVEPGEYELRLATAGEVLSPALPLLVSPGSAGRTW